MRVLWCCVALALAAGCKHQPDAAASAGDDVVAGELVVGAESGATPETLVTALALDGYRFEYVAAASSTTHLMKVARLDGEAVNAAATAEVVKKLGGRPGVKYVELNRTRQIR